LGALPSAPPEGPGLRRRGSRPGSGQVDVSQEVRALTDGKGADVAFEATSVQVVLDTLMDALRPTGVLLNISIWGHRSDFDMHKLVMKEIDLRGSIGYVNNHPAVIELVESGKIDLA